MLRWLERFADLGIRNIVQLGSWTRLWQSPDLTPLIEDITARLREVGQAIWVVDGDGDGELRRLPRNGSGSVLAAEGIRYLPRGTRGWFETGRTWAALGGGATMGAASHGWVQRQEIVDGRWWPDEIVSDEDIEALGEGHADVLFAHDMPSGVPAVSEYLRTQLPRRQFTFSDRMYDIRARGRFTEAFHLVSPRVHFGAHFPLYVNQVVGFDGGRGGYATRIVLLDALDSPLPCAAILDVETLDVSVLGSEGERVAPESQVLDLTVQTMGRWRVLSRDSTHLFDLDRHLWLRSPGPLAGDGLDQTTRRVRSIERCRVGERGYWTMPGAGYLIDYSWHDSSVIRFIEPFEGHWPDMGDG
ncbi:hypothetical protein [Agromyces sp. NPDC058126]|uniref:hypothetical protein n=1 Tax=Agromyces sp. NPDC058126 TaxID=3346350 RepID=UPI0036D98AE3